MLTIIPNFHQKIMIEGRKNLGAQAVPTQALCLEEHSDEPRLIYVSQ